MKPLPLAALVAAAMLTTLIAFDIAWNAFNPDQPGPWADGDTHPYLVRTAITIQVGLFALLAAALIQSGRAIDGGSRLVRVIRWILIGCFTAFALLYSVTVVNPTFSTAGVYEVVVTVAFAGSLLLPIVMGFVLIRRREFRVPAVLLISPIAVFPLVLILSAFTAFAHPGYLETVVNFGLALLCLKASSLPTTSADSLAASTAIGHQAAARP